ncbi:MAG: ribosome-associated translation inhibitor RaiA [Myxococcota bacterium]
MRIDIRGHNITITDGLRIHIEQRLAPVLRHYDRYLERIEVRLDDVNGPKGGDDMTCKLVAYTRLGVVVNVSETRTDMYAAIDVATDLLDRAIQKHVGRARSPAASQRHSNL